MMKTESTVRSNYQSIEIPDTVKTPKKDNFCSKTTCGIITSLVLIIGFVFGQYVFKWNLLANNRTPNMKVGLAAGEQPATAQKIVAQNKQINLPAPGAPPGACTPAEPAPISAVLLLAAYDLSSNIISTNPWLASHEEENEQLAIDFPLTKINENDINYLLKVTNNHLNDSTSFILDNEIYFDTQLNKILTNIDNNFHERFPFTLQGLTKKEMRVAKINSTIGCSYALHADAQDLDGSVKVGSENVKYTAIIYLSNYNEFVGGELEFISPFLEKTIVAKKGNGLLFSSSINHLHKVNRVEQGDRYTLRILYQ